MKIKKIGIATDHGGYGFKEELVGCEVVDLGAHSLNLGGDYPDYVQLLACAVIAGEVKRGIAICGGWGRGLRLSRDIRVTELLLVFFREAAFRASMQLMRRL